MNSDETEASTRCPHCGKGFRISRRQIEAAQGSVRCGACKRIFDARSSLSIAGSEPGPGRLALVTAQVGDLPVMLQGKPRRPLWLTGLLILLCTIAAITAALQLYLWNWAQLRVHPSAGPWLETICQHTRCPEPAGNMLELLRSDGLIVRTHPQYQGALAIDLQLQNQARFSQPWPDLLFVFSDLDGKTIAARRFHASEYLPEDKVSPLLAPGARTRIHLDISDPGPEASGYVVHFLPAAG